MISIILNKSPGSSLGFHIDPVQDSLEYLFHSLNTSFIRCASLYQPSPMVTSKKRIRVSAMSVMLGFSHLCAAGSSKHIRRIWMLDFDAISHT